MKKIKCIFCDLDGTLIPLQGTFDDISQETITLVKEWLSLGNDFVIATGRDRNYIYDIERVFGKPLNLIASNGASIIKDGKEIYQDALSKERVLKVINSLIDLESDLDFFIQLTDLSIVYHYELSEFLSLVVASAKRYSLQEYIDNVETRGYKAFIHVPDHTKTSALKEIIRNRLDESYKVITSSPYYIEIMDQSVDKWIAVKKYCELMNYELDEVVTIGDEENDINMLKNVPLSFAMETGRTETKQAASQIVSHINEVLKKLLV